MPPVFFVPQAMAMPPLFSSCCPLYLVFRAESVAYKAFVDLLLLVTLFVFQRLRPINRVFSKMIKDVFDHFFSFFLLEFCLVRQASVRCSPRRCLQNISCRWASRGGFSCFGT